MTDSPYESEKRKREAAERRRRQPTKLSYKDQRELDKLPAEIEELESTIAALQQTIAEPGFYAQEGDSIQAKLAELAECESQLEKRIERWGELESLAESLQSG